MNRLMIVCSLFGALALFSPLISTQSGSSSPHTAVIEVRGMIADKEAARQRAAAQQEAQSMINQANTYSQQVTQRAMGEAQSFDKVYEQYRLAPGVTRRRMYYETMEQVLGKLDKTIVETPGVVPYLPLPAAARKAPEPPAAATQGAPR